MDFKKRYIYDLKTDLLGKGGFARVYKAYDVLLERYVAIKIFPASESNQGNVLDEIKKAIRLHHPNLLQYFDVALLDGTNAFGETEKMQIGVMEYANYSDLKVFVRGNPTNPYLDKLLLDVIKGLAYLHSKNIIHRDLKPQNILLVKEGNEITAKISDFGISKFTDGGGNSSSAVMGTIEYMAPEQFNPGKYGINGKINTNLDIWSFGILVYELITNQALFGQRSANATSEQIMVRILADAPPGEIEQLKEPYKTIVKKCLVTDANKRIRNIEELIPLLTNTGATQNKFDESNETLVFHKNPESSGIHLGSKKPVAHSSTTSDDKAGKGYPGTNGKKKKILLWIIPLALLLIAAAVYFLFIKKTTPNDPYTIAREQLVAKDTLQAINAMNEASRQNNDSATLWLANYYYDKAIDITASANVPGAKTVNPTDMYSDSAVIYFESLTIKNMPEAQYKAGLLMSKNGFKGYPAKEKALDYLTKAAQNGYTNAQYKLGEMYILGSSINEADNAQGFMLTKMAAEKGNVLAQSNLGYCYGEGIGINQNSSLSFEWYLKAANQGNPIAQYMTGTLYEQGKGVEKNMKDARRYFELSANQHYKPAIEKLESFRL